MRYLFRYFVLLLALSTMGMNGLAQSHAQKHAQNVEKNAQRQYRKEHQARLHRHRTHNGAERAAAHHAYAKEHKARLHRHRAVLAAKRRAHERHKR